MDNPTLHRSLNSIGKQAFVRCFWSLRAVAQGRLSEATCAQKILEQGYGTQYSGARIRIGQAKRIFKAGRERDAIDLILASGHPATQKVQHEARHIRDRLDSPPLL